MSALVSKPTPTTSENTISDSRISDRVHLQILRSAAGAATQVKCTLLSPEGAVENVVVEIEDFIERKQNAISSMEPSYKKALNAYNSLSLNKSTENVIAGAEEGVADISVARARTAQYLYAALVDSRGCVEWAKKAMANRDKVSSSTEPKDAIQKIIDAGPNNPGDTNSETKNESRGK